MAPTISVIIPAYNAERTILATIGSVLGQTFADFELIVVDDGSHDGTQVLLQTLHDARVRILSCGHQGAADARNAGIAASRGQYISFIDADDLWLPDKLAHQLAVLEKNDSAGVAYSWTVVVDHRGAYLFAQPPVRHEGNVLAELITNCFIASGSNVLVRTDCVRKAGVFDPRLTFGADWEFYVRLAKHGNYSVVPAYQICYRHTAGSMSDDVRGYGGGLDRTASAIFSNLPDRYQCYRKKALSNNDLYLASLCLSRSPDTHRLAMAGGCLRRAVAIDSRAVFRKRAVLLMGAWLLLAVFSKRDPGRLYTRLQKLYGQIQCRRWHPMITEDLRREIRRLSGPAD